MSLTAALPAVAQHPFEAALLDRVAVDGMNADAVFADLRQELPAIPLVEFAGHLTVVPISGLAADQVGATEVAESDVTQLLVLRPFRGALPAINRDALMVDGVSILGTLSDTGLVAMGRHGGLEPTSAAAKAMAVLTSQRIALGEAAVFIGLSYEDTNDMEVVLVDRAWWPFDNTKIKIADFRHNGWRVLADVDHPIASQLARKWGDEDTQRVLEYYDEVATVSAHMKKVAMAMITYQLQHDQQWPVVMPTGTTFPAWNNDDAQAITAASLEHLAALSGDELPREVFQDPRQSQRLALPAPREERATIATQPRLEWSSWLCFDWSVPAHANGTRAVLSHREPLLHPQTGQGQFVVVFGNGRVRVLDAVAIPNDGIHSVLWHLPNPFINGDDLFAPGGERGDMFSPAQGDERRAFLR